MATSGLYTFGRNRDQIIKAALIKVGAIEAGETPSSEDVTDAAVSLNSLVKHWQGIGIHIWRVSEATLFLQLDQTQYTLSTSTSDHVTESFVETTLSADAADGAASISVTSASGISAGNNVGVVVDDGTIHWTTGTVSGTTITLASALDDSATSGARVIAYANKIVRPLKILSARRYNFDSALDTPLMEMDRVEYREMPNKATEATPTSYFYDRRGGANTSGLLYVWPEPSSVEDAVKFTFARPVQDFSAAGDDPDLPQEWIDTLIYNLALRLADDYDVPDSKYVRIEKMANQLLGQMQWHEQELESVSFSPDLR